MFIFNCFLFTNFKLFLIIVIYAFHWYASKKNLHFSKFRFFGHSVGMCAYIFNFHSHKSDQAIKQFFFHILLFCKCFFQKFISSKFTIQKELFAFAIIQHILPTLAHNKAIYMYDQCFFFHRTKCNLPKRLYKTVIKSMKCKN